MTHDRPTDQPRLLRIQEVSAEVGLTPRSVRYYEEIGLLKPAARSEGAYRLYDADDLDRLRFIKGLRDDAGFSLAEIKQLLEDEQARRHTKALFRASEDPAERRALALEGIAAIDRQIETLQGKIRRLRAMIAEARVRRSHFMDHVERIDGGEPRSHVHVATSRRGAGRGPASPGGATAGRRSDEAPRDPAETAVAR